MMSIGALLFAGCTSAPEESTPPVCVTPDPTDNATADENATVDGNATLPPCEASPPTNVTDNSTNDSYP